MDAQANPARLARVLAVRPPAETIYFSWASSGFSAGKTVALVKLPAPMMPITPLPF